MTKQLKSIVKTKSVASLLDLCIWFIDDTDDIDTVAKLPDVAEYAKQSIEWFRLVNNVRLLYFQPMINWSDCFGNFDDHFSALLNHLHPYTVALRDDYLESEPLVTEEDHADDADDDIDYPQYLTHDDFNFSCVINEEIYEKTAELPDHTIYRLSSYFDDYDMMQVKLVKHTSDPSSLPPIDMDVNEHETNDRDVKDELYHYADSQTTHSIRYAGPRYDCVVWALNKVSKRECLNLVSVIRYFECAYRLDTCISLCEAGIIKRTDIYAEYIFKLALIFADYWTVKWFVVNSFIPVDAIDIELLLKLLRDVMNSFPDESYECHELEHRCPDEIEATKLLIVQLLFTYVKCSIRLYDELDRILMNEFVVLMYSLDVKFAEAIGFDDIRLDWQSLIELTFRLNTGNLLSVATLDAVVSANDLAYFLPNDRVDLFEYVLNQAKMTAEDVKTECVKLLTYVCRHKASKIAKSLYQHGVTAEDIDPDSPHAHVQWFNRIVSIC
jgi:hypothetical protein